MRILLLAAYALYIVFSSMKNWFLGICLFIPIMALLEREDMPREMFNIPGFNIYNLVLVVITICFIIQNKKERNTYNGPQIIKFLFFAYITLFFIAFIRLIENYDNLYPFYEYLGKQPPPKLSIIKSELILRIKWIVPAILICIGVSSRQRALLCLKAITATALLLSLQIISRMFPALIGHDDMAARALRVIDKAIGYHRTDLGGFLSGSAWACLAYLPILKNKQSKLFCILSFGIITLALFLTGSRAGYGAWAICGGLLLILRWRRLIFFAVPAALAAIIFVPGVQDRIMMGFDEDSHSGYAQKSGDTVDDSGRDLYQITSGRVILWPLVVEEIKNAPLFGYGLQGFRQLGINLKLLELKGGGGESVGHSHNAFLDLALESGLLGLTIILIFYIYILNNARKNFSKKNNEAFYITTSGFVLSHTTGQLVAYTGQGSLFPDQIAFFMYIVIAVYISSNLRKNALKDS